MHVVADRRQITLKSPLLTAKDYQVWFSFSIRPARMRCIFFWASIDSRVFYFTKKNMCVATGDSILIILLLYGLANSLREFAWIVFLTKS